MKSNPLAAMLVSKYFCIVYILYIFVVTYYLSTDSIKDFFKAIGYSGSDYKSCHGAVLSRSGGRRKGLVVVG